MCMRTLKQNNLRLLISYPYEYFFYYAIKIVNFNKYNLCCNIINKFIVDKYCNAYQRMLNYDQHTNYKINLRAMNNSASRQDPQTFRNVKDEQKTDKQPQDQTAYNSLHYSSLHDKNSQGINCLCANLKGKTYLCQICQRLRLICPFNYNAGTGYGQSSSIKMNGNTTTTTNHHKFRKIEDCQLCKRGFPNKTANIKIDNIKHRHHSGSRSPVTNHHQQQYVPKVQNIKPTTVVPQYAYSYNNNNSAVKKKIVIEQLIYYPVFHNIYVPAQHNTTINNPQSMGHSKNTGVIDNRHPTYYNSHHSHHSHNKNSRFNSPQYKYRHRSGTTNQPQSSPIKIEQYHNDDTVLTPQRIRRLTQSMIS